MTPRARALADRALDLSGTDGRKGVAIAEVASESRPDRWYKVYRQPDGSLFCSCPDYVNRRRWRGEECKHLRRLREQRGLRAVPVPPAADLVDLAVPRFLLIDLED